MSVSRRECCHESLLDSLEQRVRGRPYGVVERHLTYDHRGFAGELDLVRCYRGVTTYYEVKTHDSRGARSRAALQFARVKRAYPGVDWRFVYVTSERVERWRL